jgi:hypothetical protein
MEPQKFQLLNNVLTVLRVVSHYIILFTKFAIVFDKTISLKEINSKDESGESSWKKITYNINTQIEVEFIQYGM